MILTNVQLLAFALATSVSGGVDRPDGNVAALVHEFPSLPAPGLPDEANATVPEEPAEDGVPLATDSIAQPAEALPIPASLKPQVEFWKRVYSEIDSQHGFVHDNRHMDVVYETVAIPPYLSYRAARRFAKSRTHHISLILQDLAAGRRDNLTLEESQILKQWPANVTAGTLAEAAHNVRFQTGQRERFIAGLLRARRWMPNIEATMARYGLPRELAALPHVESSFDMRAYSKARAAGIWQFTAATARLFMKMDGAVDERYDPLRATEAAAKLLSFNYRKIGAWPAAITAYNHGTEGMRRAVAKMGTSDISTLVQNYHTRRFGFASRNFYTELLAAWEVSHNAQQYFGNLPEPGPGEQQTFANIETDAFYRVKTLARAMGVDVKTLQINNPALRPAVWSEARMIPKGFMLRVPQTNDLNETVLAARMARIPAADRFTSPTWAPSTTVARAVVAQHLVKSSRTVASARRVIPTVQNTAWDTTQPGPWAPAPKGPAAWLSPLAQ